MTWRMRLLGVLVFVVAISVGAVAPALGGARAHDRMARRGMSHDRAPRHRPLHERRTALIPTPFCPTAPGSETAPWKDPRFGADCQAQYLIDDLENPGSALYAHDSTGAPKQSSLQRLEAAVASGDNLQASDGHTTNLLSLYGLTVSGGGDDGADGERAGGLAFPSALTVGAAWDTQTAAQYGAMLGSEFHRTGLSDVLGPVIDIDRTWHTGRENENFGEDPYLAGALVAPEIRAIQAQGVMTTVKHCCAYTQEQGRSGQALTLFPGNTGENELVSERALEEIYGPPWQAAVAPQQGHAMSVMCAYSVVNATTPPPYTGSDACGNQFLLTDLLKVQYGFEGTVSPDAVTAERDPAVLNFLNGADGDDASVTLAQLQAVVGDGSGDGRTNPDGSQNLVSQARLVDVVRRLALQSVYDERFLKPPTTTGVADGVAADEATSARVAEQGAVLLDNRGTLPLGGGDRSIAVIGTQAGPNTNTMAGPGSAQMPQVANDGSAYVNPANTFTDAATGQTFGYQSALSGIISRAGSGRTVSYAPGTVGLAEQPLLSASGATSGPGALVTPDGSQAGFQATYYGGDDPTDPSDPVLGTQVVPSVDYTSAGGPAGPASIPAVPGGSPAVAIPTQYQYNQWSTTYRATYTPPVTGNYNFSVAESGTTKLYVDGRLIAQRIRDDFGYVDHASVPLTEGKRVSIVLDYSPEEAAANTPATLPVFSSIFNTFLGDEVHLGATAPPASGPTLIQQAAATAARADVAVVFAGREIGEGHDIETLSLPGDENAMIDAVARANPHTIVVLTGGPVTMPWLHQVGGVLEMWEPGATFGTAVASLLFGDTNPSGRLPITFPAADSQGLEQTPADYPGITDLATGASDDYEQLQKETYSEGVDVGYRWYETHGQQPLFPFGYGLSYSTFTKRIVGRFRGHDGTVILRVADTNRGTRGGADVIEGYVHDPPYTGEPPEQLRAFAKVWLDPGQSKVVSLQFHPGAFAYWDSGPATGIAPRTTSPTAPQAMPSPQPAGHWVVASGTYRIDIGGSSERFDDSTHLRLGRGAARSAASGIFGWTLGGGESEQVRGR